MLYYYNWNKKSYIMHDYIQNINEEGHFGGEFKLWIAYNIFNINIVQYLIERDNNNSIIILSFAKYINDSNNEHKNLLILVNEGWVHLW